MTAKVPPPTPTEIELLRARVQIFTLQRQISDLSCQLASRDLAAAEAALAADEAAKKARAVETMKRPMQADAETDQPGSVEQIRRDIPMMALELVQHAVSRSLRRDIDPDDDGVSGVDAPHPPRPFPDSGAVFVG